MKLRDFIELKIIESDNLSLTVYQLLVFVFILIVTWIVLKIIRRVIFRKWKYDALDKGSKYAIFQIAKYLIWVISLSIGLETIGIKLNLLIASSAALLVGIGLGLQQVFMDYLAGLLILFEGNLKVHDVVEIESLVGEVIQIGLRTTKVKTRDNFIIIVPNNKFINDNLINWSHVETITRFHVDVGVAYGSDVEKVKEVLLNCTHDHPEIIEKPDSFVRFIDFADLSLNFQLLFGTAKTFRVENMKSDLRFNINKAFESNDIMIALAQRYVHIIKENEK